MRRLRKGQFWSLKFIIGSGSHPRMSRMHYLGAATPRTLLHGLSVKQCRRHVKPSTFLGCPLNFCIGNSLLLFALFLARQGGRACRSNIAPHTSDPAILHFQAHVRLPRDAAIVGDHDHSLTLLGKLLQQLDNPFAIAVIQVAGRLVRQDHPRVIGQCARSLPAVAAHSITCPACDHADLR